MASRLLVLQHVPHERLGTFEEVLREAGWSLVTWAIAETVAAPLALQDVAGLIIMGGPQSVYERRRYPWIAKELALLREAMKRGMPMLGVCLGAQMLVAALGATVTKNTQKELGWYPLMREPGAEGDPLFAAFEQTETVFQWHGDTFTLPEGAVRLASSPLCREQAFRYGNHVYGLQFHVEVTEPIIRAWMRTPVNRAELAALRGVIDPMAIRRQTPHHTGRLRVLARHVATTFSHLCTTATPTAHG